MKILQLCKKPPYPAADGEAIAILSITQELHRRGHQIHVLYMNTPKHRFNPNDLPDEVNKIAQFEAVFVNTAFHFFREVKAFLSGQSVHIERFNSAEFGKKIAQLLQAQQFDVLQMEGIYLAAYLPLIRKIAPHLPVIMRTHNIEHAIWYRVADEEKNPLKRYVLTLLARRLEQFEYQMLPRFDAIASISPADTQIMKNKGGMPEIMTLPVGVNMDKYPYLPPDSAATPNLFFIGSLDWLPNRMGLHWLFEKVMPVVQQTYPKVQLVVAGRNASPDFLTQQISGVHIIGEVPNAITFMQEQGIMLAPLFSGSGMRVKIIEGMALGKPIVATSIAAEGIACQSGKDIFIADEPQQFAQHICQLLSDHQFCQQLGANARTFVHKYHNNSVLVAQLEDLYTKQLKKHRKN